MKYLLIKMEEESTDELWPYEDAYDSTLIFPWQEDFRERYAIPLTTQEVVSIIYHAPLGYVIDQDPLDELLMDYCHEDNDKDDFYLEIVNALEDNSVAVIGDMLGALLIANALIKVRPTVEVFYKLGNNPVAYSFGYETTYRRDIIQVFSAQLFCYEALSIPAIKGT